MCLGKCLSSMKYHCLQAVVLAALFVCAPTQVVGRCYDGTTFTALPVVTSPAIGTTNVKIDCVTNPPNQKLCLWSWQYKVNNMWRVVTDNSSGPSTGYYFLSTGSLLISSVKQAHGTTYMCTNPSASMASTVPAILYIQAQLSYASAKKDICVDVGSNAGLSFLAMGNPAPSLSLYKQVQNTWNVVTDKRFVLNQSSLYITSAQFSDAGVYSLRANVSIISSYAELVFSITVTGTESPRATLLPNSSMIVARESDTLSITCSIQASAYRGVGCNGYPVLQAAAIRWTRNGAAIQESKQRLYTMTNLSAGISILKSDYLVNELSGQYKCEASNAQGFSTVSTTVQVYKVCEINPCLNGGTCIPDKTGKAFCLCSEQNGGDYCENAIIKSIYFGEFEVGTVIRWEFNAPPQGSVDLLLGNDTDDLLKISVQYDKKYVSFSSPSEEEGGLVINSNGTGFIHHYTYIGMPSGKIIMSTTSGTVAVGKKLFIPSYQPGTVIYIHGVTPGNGDFAIHLYASEPQKLTVPLSADIALAIKPLFNETAVTLNSLIGGLWGVPQRERTLPLEPSKPFVVAITWQLYGYEIALNGVHFTTYNHRLPFSLTSTVMAQSLDYVYRIRLY
ncbi:hypothetical protein EMCRGX_G022971 [Ephydatia muelleri]